MASGSSFSVGKKKALRNQESVGCDAHRGVMMEATPAAAFIMPEPDLLLEFLIIALDAPAQLGSVDQIAECDAARQGREPVLGRLLRCPYGLGACWGGAHEALKKLPGVAAVAPISNAADSTADVYIRPEALTALDDWPAQFAYTANASYEFRGIEVWAIGPVQVIQEALRITLTLSNLDIVLAPPTDIA